MRVSLEKTVLVEKLEGSVNGSQAGVIYISF